ncbi:monovalent cation:H+ antiporter, CPA1 (nhx1), partial [Teratosphaeriaceae sp. CCFEE 6253]
PGLEYKPLFILVTVLGICLARWCAVFPLSALINSIIRYRARRRARLSPLPPSHPSHPSNLPSEEIPWNWKVLIFWAGLRGAVGVALAAGLAGPNAFALRATVLVVVVLTVIIFGGTTARMLEILEIRTGVVEEAGGSDDEFDIEPIRSGGGGGGGGGIYRTRNGKAVGHTPKHTGGMNGSGGGIGLDRVGQGRERGGSTYSSGHAGGSPDTMAPEFGRRNSSRQRNDAVSAAEQGLLDPESFSGATSDYDDDEDEEGADLDLPPAARRSPARRTGEMGGEHGAYPVAGSRREGEGGGTGTPQPQPLTTRAALSQILNASTEDAGNLFSKLDEEFLKPHLLLDPGGGGGGGSSR